MMDKEDIRGMLLKYKLSYKTIVIIENNRLGIKGIGFLSQDAMADCIESAKEEVGRIIRDEDGNQWRTRIRRLNKMIKEYDKLKEK